MSSVVIRDRSSETSKKLLIQKYLRCVITQNENGQKILDPWLILQDLELAYSLAEEIALRIDSEKNSGIGILADSGMPLGILVSQILNKPIYLYRRKPWDIEDLTGTYFVFPQPNPDSVVDLIDSHITTGFTSCSCNDYLLEKGVLSKSLIVPINFFNIKGSDNNKYSRETLNNLFIIDANKIEDILLDIFKVESMINVVEIIKEHQKEEFYDQESNSNGYVEPKINRFVSLTRSFLFNKKRKIDFTYLDENLAQLLNESFGSKESEVWSFFTDPKLVKYVCKYIGEIIDLSNFNTIVGTGVLGTIFGICLAWHNNYSGTILSTYRATGWNSKKLNNVNNNCLIVSGRMRTGQYFKGAVKKISESGLIPSKALVVRMTLEGVKFPRKYFINDINIPNCEIIAIS